MSETELMSVYARYCRGVPECCVHPFNEEYSAFLDSMPNEDEHLVFPNAVHRHVIGICLMYFVCNVMCLVEMFCVVCILYLSEIDLS